MPIRMARLPDMQRVVVGVDPSGTAGAATEKANSVGIIAAGFGVDGIGYILADYTCTLGPLGWARRVMECFDTYQADRIVVERNFGGAMVESNIRTVAPSAPIKLVVASRGKVARAEPVAALYEQGKIRHVGRFPDLEDQMVNMTSEGYLGGDMSPDRVDALVWAITDLMLPKRYIQPDAIGLPYTGADEPYLKFPHGKIA